MFAGGSGKVTYTMEYVPLRIGVKIRPDTKFYSAEA